MTNVHKLNGSNGSGTLEERIVAALQDPNITAADLATLIADAEQGLIDATTIAERMQEIVVDPVASPDAKKAIEAAEFATLVCKRLANAIPRLQQKHAATVAQQRRARWNEAADAIEANRTFLAAEFAELYPQFLAKIIESVPTRLRHERRDRQPQHLSAKRRRAAPGEPELSTPPQRHQIASPHWRDPVAACAGSYSAPSGHADFHPGGNWAQAIDQRNRERHAESASGSWLLSNTNRWNVSDVRLMRRKRRVCAMGLHRDERMRLAYLIVNCAWCNRRSQPAAVAA